MAAMKTLPILIIIFFFNQVPPRQSWLIPQPIENTWVTLAKKMNQDTFCLRSDSPKDPLQTCLVSINWDIDKLSNLVKKSPHYHPLDPHPPQFPYRLPCPGYSFTYVHHPFHLSLFS